jgi:hypothetical protein
LTSRVCEAAGSFAGVAISWTSELSLWNTSAKMRSGRLIEVRAQGDPITRGDPESPLRWTCKSTHVLSAELFVRHGMRLSHKTVAKLLRDHGYSLQAPNKSVEGAQHPDHNAQFEHINAKAQDCIERGIPVISVDTKKKELVGNFKNGGREWQPAGEPDLVDVHDFPSDAVGKAIPYGVYDLAANDGFVSVGVDHDTPVFAVTSIAAWWNRVDRSTSSFPGP